MLFLLSNIFFLFLSVLRLATHFIVILQVATFTTLKKNDSYNAANVMSTIQLSFTVHEKGEQKKTNKIYILLLSFLMK
jgi:hypothetical protein